MFFEPLKNTEVLIAKRGYVTAKVYTRNGEIFAKMGSTYHRLTPNGGVGGTTYRWIEFAGDCAEQIVADRAQLILLPARPFAVAA